MFQFLLGMFQFSNIMFHLCRMGNKKPKKKKPKSGRPTGSRSHQNICLNRWDEEAMIYVIQEYNSLCVQHGADNVSIKAVAESYHIPTTFWKRYIHELSAPPPKLLLDLSVVDVVVCSCILHFFSDSIVMLVFFSVAEYVVWSLV